MRERERRKIGDTRIRLNWLDYSIKKFCKQKSSDSCTYLSELCLSMHSYIYLVIQKQNCFVLSKLFSVARFPNLGIETKLNPIQSKILPLSHEETSVSRGNLNGYVYQLFLLTYIRLTATESSIHMKSIALR